MLVTGPGSLSAAPYLLSATAGNNTSGNDFHTTTTDDQVTAHLAGNTASAMIDGTLHVVATSSDRANDSNTAIAGFAAGYDINGIPAHVVLPLNFVVHLEGTLRGQISSSFGEVFPSFDYTITVTGDLTDSHTLTRAVGSDFLGCLSLPVRCSNFPNGSIGSSPPSPSLSMHYSFDTLVPVPSTNAGQLELFLDAGADAGGPANAQADFTMTIPAITVSPNFREVDTSQLTLEFGNGQQIPITGANPVPMPEPTSLLLIGSGLLCLAGWRTFWF